MKTFLFLLVINIFSQSITSDIRNSSESNSDIVKAYRLKDVEKVMDFYSDTLYYEHMLSSEKKSYSMEKVICETVMSHI